MAYCLPWVRGFFPFLLFAVIYSTLKRLSQVLSLFLSLCCASHLVYLSVSRRIRDINILLHCCSSALCSARPPCKTPPWELGRGRAARETKSAGEAKAQGLGVKRRLPPQRARTPASLDLFRSAKVVLRNTSLVGWSSLESGLNCLPLPLQSGPRAGRSQGLEVMTTAERI